MRRLIAGENERAANWAKQLFGAHNFDFRDNFTTIIEEKDGLILAAGFYNEYRGHTIDLHVAAVGRNWLRRDTLIAAFSYPFLQLGVRRIGTTIPEKNEASLRFVLHLGFQIEGRMREACDDGSDLLRLGMLRRECRHLSAKLPIVIEANNVFPIRAKTA